MKNPFDIVGEGAGGCAIGRELSRYGLKVFLLEANSDVGVGTSKASTATWKVRLAREPLKLVVPA